MIRLDKYEKLWINLILGNLQDKYPYCDNWCDTLIPLYKEIYGINSDDKYHIEYLNVIFSDLFDLYLKIKDNESNQQLKDILFASFNKGIIYDDELPIERVIHKLCGLIQCTKHSKNGELRFEI